MAIEVLLIKYKCFENRQQRGMKGGGVKMDLVDRLDISGRKNAVEDDDDNETGSALSKLSSDHEIGNERRTLEIEGV